LALRVPEDIRRDHGGLRACISGDEEPDGDMVKASALAVEL
jgi:hypothetical protein